MLSMSMEMAVLFEGWNLEMLPLPAYRRRPPRVLWLMHEGARPHLPLATVQWAYQCQVAILLSKSRGPKVMGSEEWV